MRNIPVVDVNITELELKAVEDVIKSKYLIEGENARSFESKFAAFTGSKHCTITMNGTTALHAAFTSLGIGPGDEVITTPFTFIASSNAITFNGAIPIFVDIDKDTYNIDPEQIELAITPKTKAILPVHIFGNPCDMKHIQEIATKYNLLVIEDCAQAHDARIDGKHVGTFSDIGCFSFYGTKNLVGGEGGALITNDDDLFDKILSIKNHGRSPAGGYHHFHIGYNYRSTDIIAAIMNIQMDRADAILQRRHTNGCLYRKLLQDISDLQLQHTPSNFQSSDYIFAPLNLNPKTSPENVISYLKSVGISSRTIYNELAYQQPAYLNIKDWIFSRVVSYPDYSMVKCPNAEFVAKNHFELPMVSTLSDEDIKYIVDHLVSYYQKID